MVKIESGAMELVEEAVDITTLIDGAARMVSPQTGDDDITLDFDIAANLPLLFADAVKLRQILLNLLPNAIKYTPPGVMGPSAQLAILMKRLAASGFKRRG